MQTVSYVIQLNMLYRAAFRKISFTMLDSPYWNSRFYILILMRDMAKRVAGNDTE
jgi:hypothetical protein